MAAVGPPADVHAAAHVFVDDLDAPVLSAPDAHHLQRVLRLRRGEVVTVSDGAGGWRPATWTGEGRIEPEGPVVRVARPAPAITVGFAPAKGDRPEWTVQKLTELGVDRIVPLVAARSVVRWAGDRAAQQALRLSRVAREAAMQSRRMWLPEVAGVTGVGAAIAAAGAGACAVAQRGGAPPDLARPCVLVGPEGGWSVEELAEAPALVGLGEPVLRAETAAVTVGALLCALRSGLVARRRR